MFKPERKTKLAAGRVKLLLWMMATDGHVDERESKLFGKIAGISDSELHAILEDPVIKADELPTDPTERRNVLFDVVEMALADGEISDEEVEVFTKLAQLFGITGESQLNEFFQAAQRRSL
jgi:uncharacterized tellurite resistance protein B-like protein